MEHMSGKTVEITKILKEKITKNNLYRAAAIGVMGAVLFTSCYVGGQQADAKEITQVTSNTSAGASAMITTSFGVVADTPGISETDVVVTATGEQADNTVYGYTNLGIAQADGTLNIRENPATDAAVVGKMPEHAAGEILETVDGWYKIQSGKVTGYVSADYFVTGEAAVALAEEVKQTVATVTTTTLNVREQPTTECGVVAQMPNGEELEVLEDLGDWVKVDVDSSEGYVSKEFVEISVQLPKAMTMTEVRYGQGVSDARVSVVSYATQFVGNPYVWGGTSLTKGADCSGFTMSVMAKYGVSLPHSSKAQANCGKRVSASEAKPGDLFFYGSGRSINHVAIYIGNGQIVHASNKKTGIKISNAFYRSPICVTRVLPE